jgi:selenophosphate synthase
VDDDSFDPVLKSMTALNKKAAELMMKTDVHSCTDVTGFGLIGHASHLVQENRAGIELNFEVIGRFPGVMDFLKKEVYPGGLGRNRDFYSPRVEFKGRLPQYKRNLLFDPQTSGGLLISLAPEAAEKLVKKLHQTGITAAAVIGKVIESPEHMIIVR